MGEFYWKRHPNGPFATLIRIATTYLHPEADDLESLQRLAKRENDKDMRAFKAEFREAIKDPGQLPDEELSKSVRYEDGSPEAFCGVSGETSTATSQLTRSDTPELANLRDWTALIRPLVITLLHLPDALNGPEWEVSRPFRLEICGVPAIRDSARVVRHP